MLVNDLFSEFMTLSYNKDDKIKFRELVDLRLDDFIIVRKIESEYRIIYLTTGLTIVIPKIWLDIFSDFNICFGQRLLFNSLDQNLMNNQEKFIFIFLKLSDAIVKCDSLNSYGKIVIDLINEICQLGTSSFRSWVREKFECELDPIQVFTSLDTIEV